MNPQCIRCIGSAPCSPSRRPPPSNAAEHGLWSCPHPSQPAAFSIRALRRTSKCGRALVEDAQADSRRRPADGTLDVHARGSNGARAPVDEVSPNGLIQCCRVVVVCKLIELR